MSRGKRPSGYAELDRKKLWRLPAGLSLFGLIVLPLVPWISRYESGSLIRDGLVCLAAFGTCAAILGLGLGLWIGLRTRNPPAVLTAVASVVVAVLWWRQVFLPMIQKGMP